MAPDGPSEAREHYYETLRRSERGMSYHALVEEDGGEPLSELTEHVPGRSNDPLLEELWSDMVDGAPSSLRQRLDRMFVAKQIDWELSAEALFRAPQSEAEIIYFNVGLSDMTLQVAEGFYRVRIKESRGKEKMAALLRLGYVSEYAREFGEARVGALGFGSRGVDEISDLAVDLSVTGDRWALAHEGAHHILGHTRGPDASSTLLEDLPIPRFGSSTAEQEEYAADALAIVILLGGVPSLPSSSQETFEAVFGIYLTLNAIYLTDPEPAVGDAEHPPILDRIENARALCSRFADESLLDGVVDDFARLRHGVDAAQRSVAELEPE
jgi:hypothetical protein